MTLEKDSKVPSLKSKPLEDYFFFSAFSFFKWDMKNEDRSIDHSSKRAIYLLKRWGGSVSPGSSLVICCLKERLPMEERGSREQTQTYPSLGQLSAHRSWAQPKGQGWREPCNTPGQESPLFFHQEAGYVKTTLTACCDGETRNGQMDFENTTHTPAEKNTAPGKFSVPTASRPRWQ